MLVWRHPPADCAVTCFLMLHDTGWVCRWPVLSLSSIILGICLQTSVAWANCRFFGPHAVNQCCILLWLLGNLLWTWGELMWDDDEPVGILGHISFLESLDHSWYLPVMVGANCLMLPTCIFILTFYMLRFVSRPCLWSGNEDDGISPADLAYVLTPCLPLHVYYELFIVPWLLMDSSWGFMNLLDLRWKHQATPVLVFSVLAGVVAVSLQCDCLRRQFRGGQHSWRDITMVAAELAWVTGNIVWMVGDETLEEANQEAVVSFFCPGV
eukprot:CAMPEP_0178426156 /NCGR_PEP_ID=MMETSP0689_2-20121128/29093_1 /TAXON_ID=160604 /ORGANISM="Amphidinium massartii, Strain CS-259" /LENGTH=267 /DNA_ID=CAMNT_0020047841 /DNA_START=44 /DNA_END=843 /DNA_ORIENTATION=-